MATMVTRSRKPPPEQQQEQSRAKWTTALTKILVDLMVEQVRKGNKQKKNFGKKAWKYMAEDFQKKTGLKWEKEQLKSRFAALRRQYTSMKLLIDHGGFSWDEPTGSVIAKDEDWDNYIKEHPDAESLRSGGCPMYKQLCTIYSEPGTNGNSERSAEYDDEGTPNSLPCPDPLSVIQRDSSSETEEDNTQDNNNNNKYICIASSTMASRKRGRKGIDDVIANAILEMAAASKLRAAAVKQRNERFPIADCVKVLEEMEGVDQTIFSDAVILFENPNARETFLSLKVERRLTWLFGKFRHL